MDEQERVIFENSVNSLGLNLSEIEIQHSIDFLHSVSSIVDHIKSEVSIKDINLLNLNSIIPDISVRIKEISDSQELKEKKERFNVFECLTKHHLEQLHSKFLSYLLDINAQHACGNLFLNEFIEVLKDENPEIRKIFSNLTLNLISAKTIPQKYIGRQIDDPEIYGFIDIFIEVTTNSTQHPVVNIAIENKIGAIEQEDQIKRYVRFCRNNSEKYFGLYLTLDGKKSNEAGDEIYYCISYKKTILNWLDRIHDITSHIPLVQSGVFFYKKMLESKILHLPSNQVVMEIKKILLQKENLVFLKYGDEIVETIKEIHVQLRKDFFKQVYFELEKKYRVVPVDGFIETILVDDIWVKPNGGINIDDDQYTFQINKTDKIVLAISHNCDHDNDILFGLVGMKTENGKNVDAVHNEYIPVLKLIEKSLRSKLQYPCEQPDNMWFMWRHYYPIKIGVSFDSSSLNFDIADRFDEIVLEFVKEIEHFLTMWKETINEITQLPLTEQY